LQPMHTSTISSSLIIGAPARQASRRTRPHDSAARSLAATDRLASGARKQWSRLARPPLCSWPMRKDDPTFDYYRPIRGENHFEWLPGQFFVVGIFRPPASRMPPPSVPLLDVTPLQGERDCRRTTSRWRASMYSTESSEAKA
jgi:hypothetical protein